MSHQYLTKSRYMEGLQCPKLLWYEENRKGEVPSGGPMMQFVFEEGRRVGRMAQKLFPGGILIERLPSPEKHSERSLEALKDRKPLFEAGFVFGRAYALADILAPVENDQWDLYEVKSGTSVGESHLHDVAFQKYTYSGAGLKIRNCYLMHINKEYIRDGAIEPEKLFTKTDVSMEVNALIPDIEQHIKELLTMASKEKAPDIKIGPQCSKPHECPLDDVCWGILSEDANIFTLYSGGRKCFELLDNGILSVKDIPPAFELNAKQRIQVKSSSSGKTFIDKKALKNFLEKLEYPLYFLDFETLASAIPVYDRSSPYEAVPFQYSLYMVENKGSAPVNYSYIAPGNVDPRPEILEQLREKLGNKGSIIAYWATFEITCLRRSSQVYKEYGKWFEGLQGRFIDLLEPFKNFYYYSPKQAGSASLKSVLPALTGIAYDDMDINEGGAASAEYYRITFGQDIADIDRQQVRQALEKYCDLDTRGMIEILKVLSKST